MNDKKRLDWIEEMGDVRILRYQRLGQPTIIEIEVFGETEGEGPSLRDTVDAAMDKMGEES